MRQSKKSCSTNPPLAVTLNLPRRGLINATVVGSAMYQDSTASYASFQKEWRNRPCKCEFAMLDCTRCGSAYAARVTADALMMCSSKYRYVSGEVRKISR